MPVHELLIDFLRAKDLLLIVDNCEHLVEACAQLMEQLLHACPKLKIVASSREALGIAGETVYRVPSLSLPDACRGYAGVAGPIRVRAALRRAGIRRQSKIRPQRPQRRRHCADLPPSGRHPTGAGTGCGPRRRSFRPSRSPRVWTIGSDCSPAGSRTALPRQQTLRALIDWSYDLLSEPERRLFRQVLGLRRRLHL